VGREADSVRVREILLREDVRLMTLVGPPGIGKTRLAVQVAADLARAGEFAGGVAFVPLAEIEDPDLLLSAIAQALGLNDPRGPDLPERLISALGGRGRLLVLDNFEQLSDAGSTLADLLRAATSVRALVTSRAALRVEGEVRFEVPRLRFPGLENLQSLEELGGYAAVRLFEERARAVRGDFTLTAENAPVVAAICARLDGLPLAIELVAARVNILPPHELLARLGGRFVLHLDGLRGRPGRHQSLHHAVQWSYELLSGEEQSAFIRMGVFVGGFTLEAAQAVCRQPQSSPGAGPSNDPDILGLVTALVDQCLLTAEDERAGEARFGMLAVIREYALERLEEESGWDAARRRHAASFLGLAEAAEPNLYGPDQLRWLDRLAADLANLRLALTWSLENDNETGLRIATAMWRFWLVRSFLTEGREWLERLISLPNRPGEILTGLRAKALYVASHLAMTQGDTASAQRLVGESVVLARAEDDRTQLAFSLAVSGDAAARNNDLERGENLCRESLELFRAEGHARGMAFSLGILATIEDDSRQAEVLAADRLRLQRKLGDRWGIAEAVSHLGSLARMQCDYGRAAAYHEEQRDLARELGSQTGIALALNLLAWARREQGDYRRATDLYEDSLALSRETGNKWRVAGVLNGLGVIAWREGDYERAERLLRESLDLRHEIGNVQWMAVAEDNLGDVLRSEGNISAALESYRRALAVLARALHPRVEVAETLRRFAAVAGLLGVAEKAAVLFGAAQALRESVGFMIPLLDRADHDREVAAVRGLLGEAAFSSAWAKGRELSVEEAIDCAFRV
jgi:predicted ATPase